MLLAAGGKLILRLLLLPEFAPHLAGAMPVGERIESFQSRPLLLPGCLTGGRTALLHKHGLALLVDGLVETVHELLVVPPCGLSQAILCCLAEAARVLIAILLQHEQFVLRVALGSNQAREALRRLVRATLHQFEHGLQGEGSGHGELAQSGFMSQVAILARPASDSDAKQCLQFTETAGEVGRLEQALLQE